MSTPTYKNLSSLIERPESGRISIEDRVTCTKVYGGLYSTCLAGIVSKGALGAGALSGYAVKSCAVDRDRGDQGRLTIVWEAGAGSDDSGLSLPADEWSVTPENLSPRIERHPMFNTGGDFALTDLEKRQAAKAAEESDDDTRATLYDALSDAQKVLFEKLANGHESYYLAGLRYSWTSYHWTVPDLYLGGYLESPGGPLADYFSSGIDWLREADQLENSSGIYRLTRCWIGGPTGNWDADIYG